MQSLDNQIWWRSRVSTSTKLRLYNSCILPIFLYGSDCWAVSRTDAQNIKAFDQWCLLMLLGIKWHKFVSNDEVRRLTGQPNLTAIVLSRHLALMGTVHVWTTTQMPRGSCQLCLQRTGGDPEDAPASHGWASYSRIWDPTISHCLKQWIWPRTGLCGGCGRRTALRNLQLHARNDDDDEDSFEFKPTQGSHSFTDKNPGLSRTPWKILQDLFRARECLVIKKKMAFTYNIQSVVQGLK